MAQVVARLVRNEKVGSSSLPRSTPVAYYPKSSPNQFSLRLGELLLRCGAR